MVPVILVVLFLYMLELFLTLCLVSLRKEIDVYFDIFISMARASALMLHLLFLLWIQIALVIWQRPGPQLEQYCMDTLLPDLNVDPVASSSGYHEPMSQHWRDYLRKLRAGRSPAKVFIYDTQTAQLVFISDSIQYIADHVGIHRSTILRYTTTAELYLNRFLISYDPITEMENTENMDLDLFLDLLTDVRSEHNNATVQPASKSILAENVLYPP